MPQPSAKPFGEAQCPKQRNVLSVTRRCRVVERLRTVQWTLARMPRDDRSNLGHSMNRGVSSAHRDDRH